MRGAPLRIALAASRAGRHRIAELTGRAAAVLDARTIRQAAKIVEQVRAGGDRALLQLARRLDGVAARSAADLRLAAEAAGEDRGGGELPAGFPEALERAIAAVERFHAPQARRGYRIASDDGVELDERVLPLRRVGIYVPGGRASYPSTVVMTVVPARLAGVAEIAVATPPAAFRHSAALRYTLARLGVEEVWGLGGAQAVAAFAYGSESVRPVDKIVGPGGAWVTAAKRLVAGDVGIDGLAGPTEVVIVADASADPALLAADLLAQAEHDPLAAAVLVTPSRPLARQVAAAVKAQLAALAKGGASGAKAGSAAAAAAGGAGAASACTARAALERFGAALVVDGWDEALELVERIAPEHVQLVGAGAEALADRVRSAGAVFLGAATPEVFGDYVAGPSHVLPTCGSARFASALGVEDFLRRSHQVRFSAAAAARWAEAAACLAAAEGLPAHAAAARRRLP
ncbi:MAG: histidinol dehydrogenase [Acidobacteria bacterium]|nr:histidinol dehydrogenase [Acidobacteriota bacterium]